MALLRKPGITENNDNDASALTDLTEQLNDKDTDSEDEDFAVENLLRLPQAELLSDGQGILTMLDRGTA